MWRKFKLHYYLTRIAGTLHEDQCVFMVIYRGNLVRNVSDSSCRENQNTRFVFNGVFFNEDRSVYEIIWKNMVERGRQNR